jgi:phage repressor protein C with HTH and peptisase S24 domain
MFVSCAQFADMRTAEELRAEVKSIRERAGLSVRSMAEMLGMSASGYSHYELRIKDAFLPPKMAKAIADVVASRGIERSEVLALSSVDELPHEPKRVENGEPYPSNSALIPVFDVSASAGGGAVVAEYEAEVHSLAFPRDYLRKLTSNSIDNLAIISVKGESMETTLLDDDIVLLDASKTNLSYDGLFVLRFDDALHVKRVGRSPKRGHVTIISDNKELYPPMEMAVDEVDAVGKVLWYGRKV